MEILKVFFDLICGRCKINLCVVAAYKLVKSTIGMCVATCLNVVDQDIKCEYDTTSGKCEFKEILFRTSNTTFNTKVIYPYMFETKHIAFKEDFVADK